MKIIFVVPNLSAGGAERVVSILSNSFIQKNISVDILMLQNFEIAYQLSSKVQLVHFNDDLLTCKKQYACKILRTYFKNAKKENDKIIAIPFLETCLNRVLVSTFGLNVPVIASERNDPHQKGIKWYSRLLANVPYTLATHCVFQTPDAQKYYFANIRKKSDIIVNPLVMPENVVWTGQHSKKIVSVGRLEPQKNHELLIDAFLSVYQKHPDYTLEIYGNGTLYNALQAKIKALNLSHAVHLCGISPNIFNVLASSELFVLPSNYEGMSNALIEALAIGMPVVSTDHPCGGARMLVKDSVNGLLVPTQCPEALAQAMLQIIENPTFALDLGTAARNIRKELSAECVVEKWLKIINEL